MAVQITFHTRIIWAFPVNFTQTWPSLSARDNFIYDPVKKNNLTDNKMAQNSILNWLKYTKIPIQMKMCWMWNCSVHYTTRKQSKQEYSRWNGTLYMNLVLQILCYHCEFIPTGFIVSSCYRFYGNKCNFQKDSNRNWGQSPGILLLLYQWKRVIKQ